MVGLPINAVERETGLSKDLLRKWEQRYGFPQPLRDAQGDRLYPPEQVARLRLLRRLLDQGHRPKRLLALDEAALLALAQPESPHAQAAAGDHPVGPLIELLRAHDVPAIRHFLQRQHSRQGLREFMTVFLNDANRAVGEAWAHGQLSIAEEHLYTEQVTRLLRQLMQALPAGQPWPRCLLTTVSGEMHGLGLLMVEMMLRLEGVEPVNLGPNLPLAEIQNAAQAHDSQIVLLSFSSAFPALEATRAIAQVHELLPSTQALWCGGGGTRSLRRLPQDVRILTDLAELETALDEWRSSQASTAGAMLPPPSASAS